MLESLVNQVVEHANKEMPNECCGFALVVKGKLKYYPCKNLSTGEEFLIDPQDHIAASKLGEIVGICHSHVRSGVDPSEADLAACEASGLPWLIVKPEGNWHEFAPSGYKPKYIGRQFYHGVLDCYSLIRDYYNWELGIIIPDYDREVGWWDKGFDLYEENFENAGFSRVLDLQPHDVILMKLGSSIINHGAIYLEDGYILQHCAKRLSSKDLYGGFWQNVTCKVVRHRDLM